MMSVIFELNPPERAVVPGGQNASAVAVSPGPTSVSGPLTYWIFVGSNVPFAPVAPPGPTGPVGPTGPCGPDAPVAPVAPVGPGAPRAPARPRRPPNAFTTEPLRSTR